MENRYEVVKLNAESSAAKKALKAQFISLEKTIKDTLPNGRSRSLAVTRLEEAWQWVGKSCRVKTVGDEQ